MAGTVRAKFTVQRIERSLTSRHIKGEDGVNRWEQREVQTIVLTPVTSGSAENEQFYDSTPYGEIKLGTINLEAAALFPLMGEVYVDFTPAG